MTPPLVQLLDRFGQVMAEGRPDPDGRVQLAGDPSRPPVGGYPLIRIITEETTDAPAA